MILLHIPANPSAPIACDMTSASDTPEERIAEYGRLIGHAYAGRERDPLSVTLNFHDKPGVADWAKDLARREAACCPFIDYKLERRDSLISWAISCPHHADDPSIPAMLNEFHKLPDTFDSGVDGYFDRLAQQGVDINQDVPKQFTIRD